MLKNIYLDIGYWQIIIFQIRHYHMKDVKQLICTEKLVNSCHKDHKNHHLQHCNIIYSVQYF